MKHQIVNAWVILAGFVITIILTKVNNLNPNIVIVAVPIAFALLGLNNYLANRKPNSTY